MNTEELLNQNELHMAQVLKCELAELPLEDKTLRALKTKGITTLGHLVSNTREDLLKIKFLGRQRVEEIIEMLDNYDLKLKR